MLKYLKKNIFTIFAVETVDTGYKVRKKLNDSGTF